jgi:alpha-tubulin suppressor-like RCC1 family protein
MCAALSDGTVRCWGSPGLGATGDAALPHTKPVPVSGLANVVQVVVTANASGARRSDGAVFWWGSLYKSGTPGGAVTKTATAIPGVTGSKFLSIGTENACSVNGSGSVRCFGQGPFGDGTTDNYDPAKDHPALASIGALTLSRYFGFALTGSDAKAWGGNSSGQLGDGSTDIRLWAVTTFGGATQIAASWNHACAVLSTGGVRCTGQNSTGELGDGTASGRSTPVDVVGLGTAKATQVCAGDGHSCARMDDGTVKCWGSNSAGELGDGTKSERRTAVSVLGLATAKQVACGASFTCSLLTDGTVKCWGSNSEGQLGDGTGLGERLTPWTVVW